MTMFLLGFLSCLYFIGIVWCSIDMIKAHEYSLFDKIILPWCWPIFLLVYVLVAPIAIVLNWRYKRSRRESHN